MRTQVQVFAATLVLLSLGPVSFLAAQQPQIPTLQVCNITLAKGRAVVQVLARQDATSSGTFEVTIADSLSCQPNGTGYPAGSLQIRYSMNDSNISGLITAVTFEQMTSTGKRTPTLYLNGRCKAGEVRGCRYWLLIADNRRADDTRGTPDIVSLLVFNGLGQRVAYGTGPVIKGDLMVAPTSN